MVYFDYQKAFDAFYTTSQCTVKTLKFKGNQRRQRVTINIMKSDCGSVTSGVLQGYVLRPMLFILFITIISEEVGGAILLLADDTMAYKIINTDNDELAMQANIYNLHRWPQAWLMTCNKKKCKTMHAF